jgi:hypothetical protein
MTIIRPNSLLAGRFERELFCRYSLDAVLNSWPGGQQMTGELPAWTLWNGLQKIPMD